MPHRIVGWVLVLVLFLKLPVWGADGARMPLDERPLPTLPRAVEGAIVGRSGGGQIVAGGRDVHSGGQTPICITAACFKLVYADGELVQTTLPALSVPTTQAGAAAGHGALWRRSFGICYHGPRLRGRRQRLVRSQYGV